MNRLRYRVVGMMCVLCLSFQAQLVRAQSSSITVQVDKPGGDISPTMFGIFFEDINFGADGGLYPERVKNRSFEFPEALMAWKQIGRGDPKGTVAVLDENPINANNSHYLHIEVEKAGAGFGVTNEGFRGIGVQRSAAYTLSLYARNVEHAQRAGNTRRVERNPVALRIELEDGSGRSLSKGRMVRLAPTWKKYAITLTPSATSLKAHLNILVEGRGAIDVDMVSLFPKGTWKNRENGLRSDLVQLLKDMKPGFLRFPVGS